MLLAILFFIEVFHIRILVLCCCFLSIYACIFLNCIHAFAHIGIQNYIRRAGSVNRAGSLFKNEPARFQLTSCNSEEISTELTTDGCVGFKMMQNSLPSYKRASSPHVSTTRKEIASSRVTKIRFYVIKIVVLIKLRSHEIIIENYI